MDDEALLWGPERERGMECLATIILCGNSRRTHNGAGEAVLRLRLQSLSTSKETIGLQPHRVSISAYQQLVGSYSRDHRLQPHWSLHFNLTTIASQYQQVETTDSSRGRLK